MELICDQYLQVGYPTTSFLHAELLLWARIIGVNLVAVNNGVTFDGVNDPFVAANSTILGTFVTAIFDGVNVAKNGVTFDGARIMA